MRRFCGWGMVVWCFSHVMESIQWPPMGCSLLLLLLLLMSAVAADLATAAAVGGEPAAKLISPRTARMLSPADTSWVSPDLLMKCPLPDSTYDNSTSEVVC